ncbi:hypothetical protein ACLB2K_041202 [Fragaria x ananassa]
MHARDELPAEGVEVIAADAPSEYHMAPQGVEHKGKAPPGSEEVTPEVEETGEPKRRGRGRPPKKTSGEEPSSSAKGRQGKGQGSGGRGRGGGSGGGSGGGGRGRGGGGGGGGGGRGGGGGGGGWGYPGAAYNGRSFMPHIISINAGEDVCGIVKRFSVKTPRVICVMSASGAVSNVKLRVQDGTVNTHDGLFNILSLSGCLIPQGETIQGTTTWIGGLTVSLAGVDGRAFGGIVNGAMRAEIPVMVRLVGNFLHGDQKGKGKKSEPPSPPASMPPPPLSPASGPSASFPVPDWWAGERASKASLLDGLEEGGLRASSSYSDINEQDNEKAVQSLQDRVVFLKRGNDMDASRGIMSGTMARFKMGSQIVYAGLKRLAAPGLKFVIMSQNDWPY